VSDQLSQDLAALKIDRTARESRGVPGWLIWVVVLGGLGALAVFVGYPMLRERLDKATVKTGEITLVSPAQASVQLTATGYVVAEVEAKVGAKVNGRIAEIFVEEGQRIEKGAKVARLEDVDQKSVIAAARARTSSARARVAQARAALAETKQQLEREQKLVADGVSPKATVDDLTARLASLQAAIKAAEAEAAAANAEEGTLEVQLDNYIITTPISGTVVDRIVEVGEVVAPGFGSPGVIEVVDLESLVVEIDVPETRLEQVQPGAPAEIVLDAYPSQRYRGAVKEIGRRVNRAKATVPIKVSFVDRPKEVLPDMAARVSFLKEALDEKQLNVPAKRVVPTEAVVDRNGAKVVFVIEDGEVRMTPVEVGPPFGGGLELVSDLPPGTKVVLAPPAKLADGQKVKEKN
jgi:HlyD family secretion protein